MFLIDQPQYLWFAMGKRPWERSPRELLTRYWWEEFTGRKEKKIGRHEKIMSR